MFVFLSVVPVRDLPLVPTSLLPRRRDHDKLLIDRHI